MPNSSTTSTDSSLEPNDADHFSCHSSRSTAPTDYSLRPSASRGETWPGSYQKERKVSFDDEANASTASIRTYSSSLSSQQDLADDPKRHRPPEVELESYPSNAIPASSEDFAQLFPSTRRLNVTHDDASSDGNMGLRVDCRDRGDNITLFYLRMHDLRSREFSLRRYCRDSGREVCHSFREKRQDQSTAPALTRSLSSFLTKGSQSKPELKDTASANLKRHDSGYASVDDPEAQDARQPSSEQKARPSISDLTDTISFEFSNYFHLALRRTGLRSKKQYNFNYWGKGYSWKRAIHKDFGVQDVSYHLVGQHEKEILAHILPVHLTANEAQEEQYAGGWVPPCSFWLEEGADGLSADLGDIIVATGLMALVDDTIRKRFHSKETRQVALSDLAKLDPRKIIGQAIHRHQRPHTAH